MIIGSKDNVILLNSVVGIEFEFFSNKSIEDTQKDVSNLLNKKIQIFKKAHSDFEPTLDVFKMEPDFSGGKQMIELVTGPLPYIESKLIIIKVCKWISENGYTSDRCSIHLNISFNNKVYGSSFMTKMNPLKFILDFDENIIYEKFPKRKNTVYAKSIKFIVPANKYHIDPKEDFKEISPKNFIVPATKYYGVNFSKLTKGYLEFRYMGGENYEKKLDDIIEIMNDTILILYSSINEKDYSEANRKELIRIFKNYEKLLKSYQSLENFKKYMFDINLTVDMNNDPKVVNIYYMNIRDNIFKLLSESSLTKGDLNYDSDCGRLQLRGAKLNPCYSIDNVDLVDCNITGTVTHCDIVNCTITDSDIISGKLYGYSKLFDCKIKDSYVGKNVEIEKSYVFGKNGIFNGKFKSGIFREGKIGETADINSEVEIVEYKKI